MVKNENFNSGPNLGRSNTFKALNGNDQCNVYLKKKYIYKLKFWKLFNKCLLSHN